MADNESFGEKIVALVFSALVVALGAYLISCEGFTVPSRHYGSGSLVVRPETYFVGAGIVLFGANISFIYLSGVKYVKAYIALFVVSLTLFFLGV